MFEYADNAGLLAKNANRQVALLGFNYLKRGVAHGSYSCALNLMWACEAHNNSAPFTYSLLDELLLKIIHMHNDLNDANDLCLAGTLCCNDPRYGWILENGERFYFDPNSKESIRLSRSLFDKSFVVGLNLLQRSADIGNCEALWQMYECTRYKNPLNFDRIKILEQAAEGLHLFAMVEFSGQIMTKNNEEGILLLEAAASLGSLRAQEMLGTEK